MGCMFSNPISILKLPAGDHFTSMLIQRFYELFYSYIYVKCKRNQTVNKIEEKNDIFICTKFGI